MQDSNRSALSRINYAVFTALGAIAVYMLMASAANAGQFGKLCAAWNAESQDVIDVVGTIAVVTLGASAAFGKISWGMATMVAIGIATVAGASTLIADITGANGGC